MSEVVGIPSVDMSIIIMVKIIVSIAGHETRSPLVIPRHARVTSPIALSHPDWIIILFVIYLSTFWVEKLEESTCRAILAAGPNLEIWVQKII
jgi:hypothetical protein